MDWANAGSMLGFAALTIGVLAGLAALSAGLMVGLSERLIGFRVPFRVVFNAVGTAMVVTLFARGLGRQIDQATGFGLGSTLTFVCVIYFLAWHLGRHVRRPDGAPLGPAGGYWLAGVHAMLMVIVTFVGYAVIGALQ
jgi:hypothetical protein